MTTTDHRGHYYRTPVDPIDPDKGNKVRYHSEPAPSAGMFDHLPGRTTLQVHTNRGLNRAARRAGIRGGLGQRLSRSIPYEVSDRMAIKADREARRLARKAWRIK